MRKPDGKKLLGRPRRGSEDNIKWMCKKEDGGVDWIDLAEYRDSWPALANAIMNILVP